MYVLLCSLHSICRFLFNYSIKVSVVLTTFSIISIPYLLNSVLQPYFMPIYSIILLYLFICNMSHVLEINYLILSYLILLLLLIIIGFNHQYLKQCIQSELVYRDSTTQEVGHCNHDGCKQSQGCGLHADTVQPYK